MQIREQFQPINCESGDRNQMQIREPGQPTHNPYTDMCNRIMRCDKLNPTYKEKRNDKFTEKYKYKTRLRIPLSADLDGRGFNDECRCHDQRSLATSLPDSDMKDIGDCYQLQEWQKYMMTQVGERPQNTQMLDIDLQPEVEEFQGILV